MLKNEFENINGVKRFRNEENNITVLAIKFNGKNAKEMQEFTQARTFVQREGGYIKCGSMILYKTDWAVRVLDIHRNICDDFYTLKKSYFRKQFKELQKDKKCH